MELREERRLYERCGDDDDTSRRHHYNNDDNNDDNNYDDNDERENADAEGNYRITGDDKTEHTDLDVIC